MDSCKCIQTTIVAAAIAIVAIVGLAVYGNFAMTQEFVKGGYESCTLQGSNYVGWCKK